MAERKPFVWGASGVELLQTGDTLGGISSGAMELIQSVSISSPVATVSFTGLTSSYYTYIVIFDALLTPVEGSMLCQLVVDGVWQTANYEGYKLSFATGAVDNTAVAATNVSSTLGTSGSLTLYNASNTSWYKLVEAWVPLYMMRKEYRYKGSMGAVTGLRFLMNLASNFTSGTFKLYGLKA